MGGEKKKEKNKRVILPVELYPKENKLSQKKLEFLLCPCGDSSSFTAH